MEKVKTFLCSNMFICWFLFVIAFFLRLDYSQLPFTTSDNTAPALYGINITNISILNFKINENFISKVVAYPYGFSIFFLYVFFLALKFLGLQLTEMIATMPLVFFGSLKIVFIYKILRDILNLSLLKSFLIAFFSCVFFYFIQRDNQFIQMQMIFPSTFFLMFLYYFFRYSFNLNQKFLILSSFFCGIYFVSSNLNIGIVFFLIFLWLYFYIKENKNLFNLNFFIFPLFFIFLYLVAHIYFVLKLHDYGAGFIGKILSKPKILSFYFSNFVNIFFICYGKFFGFIFLLFFFLGIPWGLRQFRKEAIFYIGCLIYYLPFLFLISPEITITHTYVYEGTIILLISFFVFINQYIKREKLVIIIFSIFIIISIIFTIKVFLRNIKDDGIKAAGYVIRKEYNDNENIFSDTEPMRSQYYLGKEKIFCAYDVDNKEELEYLLKIYPYIDIYSLSYDFMQYLKANKPFVLDKFYFNYVIKKDGKDVRYILSKTKNNIVLEAVDIKEYNKKFDAEFGYVNKILPYVMKWPSDNKILPKEIL